MKSLLSAVLVAAGVASAADADVPVTIPFVAEIGGGPFSCTATYPGLGAAAPRRGILDFRLFVSPSSSSPATARACPVALTRTAPGRSRQYRAPRLRGRQRAAAGTARRRPTPRSAARCRTATMVGLGFEVGVPFAANHGDPTIAARHST